MTARVVVRVIAANENLMVARHTFATIFASSDAESDGVAAAAAAATPAA